MTATPGSSVTAKCSANGDKQAKIRWLIGELDATDKSDGTTYAAQDGLLSSKLLVNFTSVFDIRSSYRCENIEKFRIRCSTVVDCVAFRSDANGDRRRGTIEIEIGKGSVPKEGPLWVSRSAKIPYDAFTID